jgi:hypothetical protein
MPCLTDHHDDDVALEASTAENTAARGRCIPPDQFDAFQAMVGRPASRSPTLPRTSASAELVVKQPAGKLAAVNAGARCRSTAPAEHQRSSSCRRLCASPTTTKAQRKQAWFTVAA